MEGTQALRYRALQGLEIHRAEVRVVIALKLELQGQVWQTKDPDLSSKWLFRVKEPIVRPEDGVVGFVGVGLWSWLGRAVARRQPGRGQPASSRIQELTRKTTVRAKKRSLHSKQALPQLTLIKQ